MPKNEPQKIISGLDFHLWHTEPAYGNGGVFYGGSQAALLRVTQSVAQLGGMVREHGSGFRQFNSKIPQRIEGGLPYGVKERAPGPMSIEEAQKRHGIRFVWYRSLVLRVGKSQSGLDVADGIVSLGVDAEEFLAHLESATLDEYFDLSFGYSGLRYSPDWLGIE
jgi:hypothetical protein